LRELKFVYEQHQQAWAKEMSALLLSTKAKVERNTCRLASSTLQEIHRQYHRVLQKGFRANPPPTGDPHRRGRKTKSKSRNLLERLHTHAREILAFAHDFKIPFDNNQAERDLRMMKVQQKISGTFRSVEGARAFCRIRGFISTCHKQNLNVLHAIESVLLDKPVACLA
jgi:transposase